MAKYHLRWPVPSGLYGSVHKDMRGGFSRKRKEKKAAKKSKKIETGVPGN
jgi:hypothetical protein